MNPAARGADEKTAVETELARYVRGGQPTGKRAALTPGPLICDLGKRRSAQGLVTTGRLAASAVATELHCGCPQPLALTPSCWPG